MYDIITIGSSTIDVFVKSKQEVLKVRKHLDIGYPLGGKILIDNLIFTTGGGGTNSAVAFSRLGLKTGFMGVVGNDSNGEMILKELKNEKVKFLGSIKRGNTGYSVVLAGKRDRTILTNKGVNNNLVWSDINYNKCKWLYISTMLEDSLDTVNKLIKISKKYKTKVAVNLSIYLAKQGLSKLKPILSNTDILILNKSEASALTGKKDTKQIINSISKVVQGIIVITNGFNSVHAHYQGKTYIKTIKKINPVDTTGSGDAFASAFVYGIMKGKDIPTSLNYGHKEALSVLKHIGAKNNLLRRL